VGQRDGINWDAAGREVVEMLAELPDLWTSISAIGRIIPILRDSGEGFRQDFVRFVKTVATESVFRVGRFTPRDTIVWQIPLRSAGLIGATRP